MARVDLSTIIDVVLVVLGVAVDQFKSRLVKLLSEQINQKFPLQIIIELNLVPGINRTQSECRRTVTPCAFQDSLYDHSNKSRELTVYLSVCLFLLFSYK